MGLFFIGLGLLKLLVTVFVLLLVVRLAFSAFGSLHDRHEKAARGRAELILRRRFAEGGLEAAEYQERLSVLRKDA